MRSIHNLNKHTIKELAGGICSFPENVSRAVVYDVYGSYPPEIRERLELADVDMHYKNWADTVRSLPEKTSPLPVVNREFIHSARKRWHENIYGNEDILNVFFRHIAEYGRTGKTSPILLIGPPGIGKTLAAKNYGRIMELPYSFISGPSAAMNRGLAGAPNLYNGAGPGAIAQAMITCRTGNPVICIDEIEKTSGGHTGSPDFLNELLSALDESSVHWHDNFIEMDLDASHIPYIFTANSQEPLSAPLLDRMDIIEMEVPGKEDIYKIMETFTVPKVLKAYEADRIVFGEKELELLVELLWKKNRFSCRPYQKTVNFLISDACLKVIEEEREVQITENDVRRAADMCSSKIFSRRIGF